MFGLTYKYKLNPTKSTVKLTPTFGTYIKAFAPMLIVLSVLGVLGATVSQLDNDNTDIEDEPKK